MAIQVYPFHALLQVLAFFCLIMGAYNSRKHRLKNHHRSVYAGVVFNTLAVAIMIFQSGGLPTVHGKLGFSVYLFILATGLSGRFFLRRRIERSQHRWLAYLAILLLLSMILHGLFTFVIRLS